LGGRGPKKKKEEILEVKYKAQEKIQYCGIVCGGGGGATSGMIIRKKRTGKKEGGKGSGGKKKKVASKELLSRLISYKNLIVKEKKQPDILDWKSTPGLKEKKAGAELTMGKKVAGRNKQKEKH